MDFFLDDDEDDDDDEDGAAEVGASSSPKEFLPPLVVTMSLDFICAGSVPVQREEKQDEDL